MDGVDEMLAAKERSEVTGYHSILKIAQQRMLDRWKQKPMLVDWLLEHHISDTKIKGAK